MYIKNIKQLARTPLRRKALDIMEAGYAAIDITRAVRDRIIVKKGVLTIRFPAGGEDPIAVDLDGYRRVFLVGIGKGSALACMGIAKALGKRLTKGMAIDVERPKPQASAAKLHVFIGTHPLPSPKNVRATRRIMGMTADLREDDLVIVIMCGGGSALAVASEEELHASTTAFKELTKAGADIIELNTVRKHASEFKGGNFAKHLYPATVMALMASDVIGNDMSMIASGPTVPDNTTKKDAMAVLKKYGVAAKAIELKETPKDAKYFRNVRNALFVSNGTAVAAMREKAKGYGYATKVSTLAFKGEARTALVPAVKKIRPGQVVLMAGETTVTVGDVPQGVRLGKGGRNQEAALGVLAAHADDRRGLDGIVAVSLASDGHDNTDAAGGIADARTLADAKRQGQDPADYLVRHDSFGFFTGNGNALRAKKAAFNVADIMLVMRDMDK